MPFALVALDHPRHLLLQLFADAEAVFEDHLAQIVDPALKVIHPGTGALQAIGGTNIEHQQPVNTADKRGFIKIAGEQVGMARLHAAVAANVQVPPLLRGDNPNIFPLGFRAFAGTAGDGHFNFVRRAQPLVAMFEGDRQAGGVLDAVAAPGRTDAGFHRPQGFAVGVAGFESRLGQLAPDCRELFQARAEQVDTLAAGHLTVQLIAFGDLADRNQTVRRHLSRRHARHHRIGAVFLNIGEVAIVGVLKRQMRRLQQIFIPAGGQYRGDQRFTDLAAVALSITGNQLFEGADMVDANQVIDLLARPRKVLADILFNFDALLGKLVLHHLFHQRTTAAAAGRRFGAAFYRRHVARAGAHRLADIVFADVVTGANLRAVRQRRDPERLRRAALQRRKDQAFRVFG